MEKNGVEVITFGDKKCLNEKHIETQLELSNLVAFTKKYSFKPRKKRLELQNSCNHQRCRRFLKENFAIQIIIMDCRTTSAVNVNTNL